MTYYGINGSSQYGSNFSSVLANSPPPLDDTAEDEDEFLFSRTQKPRADGKIEEEATGINAEDEFGDFEAFADFKGSETSDSASTNWFTPTSEKQSSLTTEASGVAGQADSDDDFADFEGFRHANEVINDSTSSSKQPPNMPDGDQNGSASTTTDDDFGAFAVADDDMAKFDARFDSLHLLKSTDSGGQHLNSDKNIGQANSAPKNSSDCEVSRVKEDPSEKQGMDGKLAMTNGHGQSEAPASDVELNKTKNISTRDCQEGFRDLRSVDKSNLPNSEDKGGTHSIDFGNRKPEISQNIFVTSCKEKVMENLDAEKMKSVSVVQNNAMTLRGTDEAESQSNEEEFESFAAFDSTNCAADAKQNDFGEFSVFSTKPCEDNDEVIDDMPNMTRDPGNPVEEVKIPNPTQGMGVSSDDDFGDFSAGPVNSYEQGSKSLEVHEADIGDKSMSTSQELELDFRDLSTAQSGVPDDGTGCKSANSKQSSKEMKKLRTENEPSMTEMSTDEGFGDFSSINLSADAAKQEKGNSKMLSSSEDKDDACGEFCGSHETTNDPKRTDGMDDDFGDFSTFDSQQSVPMEQVLGGSTEHSFESGVTMMTADAGMGEDGFGDFNAFDVRQKEQPETQDHQSSELNETSAQVDPGREDDFGGLNTFNSQGGGRELGAVGPSSDSVEEEDFGDFNAFDSHKAEGLNGGDGKGTSSTVSRDLEDDFGDFNTFDSHQGEGLNADGDKGIPKSTASGDSEEDFGDFNTFNSSPSKTAVTPKNSDGDFSDFNKFSSKDQGEHGTDAFPTKVSPKQGFADFGEFSSAGEGRAGTPDSSRLSGGFTAQTQTHKLNESPHSPAQESAKQCLQTTAQTKDFYLISPSNNMNMGEVLKAVASCFSATKLLSKEQRRVGGLDTKLHQSTASDSKVWVELQSTAGNGSLHFPWETSSTQRKILAAFNITVQAVPATSSYARSEVPSLPPFASGLSLLEPIKGPYVPTTHPHPQGSSLTTNSLQFSPGASAPGLDFGFGQVPSKTGVSPGSGFNAASENPSSSLNFLGLNNPKANTDKKEHKSHYEDLLGLSLDSPSPSGASGEKSNPSMPSASELKTVPAKAVWQFGDVTIPLASQATEVKLSERGAVLLSDLEDLAFMQSPVLMFPIKTT